MTAREQKNRIQVSMPTPDGSIVDLVAELESDVTVETINLVMHQAANGPLQGILQYSAEEIVSSDIIGNTHSSIFDSLLTQTPDDRLVKVVSWYDSEWGYCS